MLEKSLENILFVLKSAGFADLSIGTNRWKIKMATSKEWKYYTRVEYWTTVDILNLIYINDIIY